MSNNPFDDIKKQREPKSDPDEERKLREFRRQEEQRHQKNAETLRRQEKITSYRAIYGPMMREVLGQLRESLYPDFTIFIPTGDELCGLIQSKAGTDYGNPWNPRPLKTTTIAYVQVVLDENLSPTHFECTRYDHPYESRSWLGLGPKTYGKKEVTLTCNLSKESLTLTLRNLFRM